MSVNNTRSVGSKMCRLLIIVVLAFSPMFAFGQASVFGTIWESYGRATREKDFDRFADLFTENALIVFSTAAENVKGRSKIKDFAKSIYSDIQAKGIVIQSEEIQYSGRLAVQTGRFIEEYTEAGKKVIEKGRFSCTILRGKNGKWKIRSLIAFADSIK